MARSVRLLRSGTSAVVRGGRCIRRQAAERLVLRPCGRGTGLVCGGAGGGRLSPLRRSPAALPGAVAPPPCCPGGVGPFRCAPLPSSEFDDGTRFAHRDGDFAPHVERHIGVFVPRGQAEDDRDSQRPHVLRNDTSSLSAKFEIRYIHSLLFTWPYAPTCPSMFYPHGPA